MMLEYMGMVKALLTKDETRDKTEESKLIENCKNIIANGIEKDILENDYPCLLDAYSTYFKTKKFQTKNIKAGKQTFVRARLGKLTLKGADRGINKDFIIPYYGTQIGSTPKLRAKGARFNREGYSYLYLASNVETCLAEIHVQVGQDCTVAEFKSIRDLKLMNLVDSRKDDLEIQLWYSIMTQPVYDAIQYKYLVTQFLADVFRENFKDGIYFKSSQAKGVNLVCFDPSSFELQEYSEKIYKATSIRYTSKIVPDSADEYTHMNAQSNHTYGFHSIEETEKKEQFNHLEELIRKRKETKKGTVKN